MKQIKAKEPEGNKKQSKKQLKIVSSRVCHCCRRGPCHCRHLHSFPPPVCHQFTPSSLAMVRIHVHIAAELSSLSDFEGHCPSSEADGPSASQDNLYAAYCKTQGFTTVFIRARHWTVPSVSWLNAHSYINFL